MGLHEPDRDAHVVKLWEAIASAANHADTLEEAAQECLDAVCSLTGWPVGHLYVVTGSALVPTTVWHLEDPEGFPALRQATASASLAVGEGLPGEVAACGHPVWIADVTQHPNFPRAAMPGGLEVGGAFAFPILLGTEVVAVLEFFSPAPAPVDHVLLDLVAKVGSQLSRVVERERAAERLAMSDERLRRILETANESYISMNADGAITEWNECAESTFGWLRHEVLGRPLAEVLVPARYREAHQRGVERFLATGQGKVVGTTVELSALHRDGHELPIELAIWAFDEGAEWTFNALIRDISVRKDAEERLKASERRLAEAQKVIGVGSWEWDTLADSVVWSDELYRIFGQSPEAFEPSLPALLALIDVRDRGWVAEALGNSKASGEPFEFEYRFTRPDGRQRVMHAKGEAIVVNGHIKGMRGTARDVTDRRRNEQELQELRAALESAVEGMAQVDTKGRYVSVNDGYAAMCGWRAEEMVGLDWTSTVHPDEHDRTLEHYHSMVDVGRVAFETTGIRRDGSPFETRVVLVSSHDDDGRFTGHFCCAQDITARKQAEAEVRNLLVRERQMVERLTQLDQDKTDFVSCVSHELRTPLTSMLGFLELLAGGEAGALNPDQAQMVGVVDRNSRRLLSLIDDLLTVLRAEAGTFGLVLGPVVLADLAKAAASAMAPSVADRSLELDVEVAEDAGTVTADIDQLDRVLTNLLSNAVKFTPQGGRVSLRVWRDADTVSIVVADNGMGIPDDEQPRLFQRFFRSSAATKHAIPGTGLGLVIVRDIVERHGGRISLRSSSDVGTEVTITLPVDSAPPRDGTDDRSPTTFGPPALSPAC